MSITELTRRNIIESLILHGEISGKLDLVSFLERTWNLSDMPSTDSRFKSASGDIWQHMVNNDDWTEHYLFFSYLDINQLPEKCFLHFLEQIVHPIVRTPETQLEFVNIINSYLVHDAYRLEAVEQISGFPLYKVVASQGGVRTQVKNLIFASNGPKPEIVLADAINNDIRITKNAEYCLVFEDSIPSGGLSWPDLLQWWARTNTEQHHGEIENSLRQRLRDSLASEPERLLFDSYFQTMPLIMDQDLPALIPQVYLHYDPYTIRERNGQIQLPRQRMDFLLLLPGSRRVVIEVDGKQHYATGDTASPRLYAEMVAADRELKLMGYEVYRFGGYELQDGHGRQVVENFFHKLFIQHGLLLNFNQAPASNV